MEGADPEINQSVVFFYARAWLKYFRRGHYFSVRFRFQQMQCEGMK